MAIFAGCSVYFWIGLLLLVGGSACAVALARRPARNRPDGEVQAGSSARRSFIVSVVVAATGLAVAGNTMLQGNCVAVRGACPPGIATGTGYPCAASGAACKVAGLFSGKCTDEASTLWTCTCQCR